MYHHIILTRLSGTESEQGVRMYVGLHNQSFEQRTVSLSAKMSKNDDFITFSQCAMQMYNAWFS